MLEMGLIGVSMSCIVVMAKIVLTGVNTDSKDKNTTDLGGFTVDSLMDKNYIVDVEVSRNAK